MQRGEVWWARLPEPVGRRPVLLLSRNQMRSTQSEHPSRLRLSPRERPAINVRNIPVEVPLDSSDGMPRSCAVNVDDVVTIPKSALTELITALTLEKMVLVRRALIYALDIR